MQPYEHELPYEAVNLDFISVKGAFDYYHEHHKIDLIIMATHHFTLWERLFHNSLTEQVEWNTNLPVLVLHDEDK